MITVASGQRLFAKGAGSVQLHLDEGKIVTLTGVLFVPQLNRKLVSISALTAKTLQFRFGVTALFCQLETKPWRWFPTKGSFLHGLYLNKRIDVQAMTSEEENPNESVWHARLGHVPAAKMELISKATVVVPSMKLLDDDHSLWEGCARGEMSNSPFARRSWSEVQTAQIFDVVHSDSWDPWSRSQRREDSTCLHSLIIYLGLFTVPTLSEITSFRSIQSVLCVKPHTNGPQNQMHQKR